MKIDENVSIQNRQKEWLNFYIAALVLDVKRLNFIGRSEMRGTCLA